eukprot:scaffold11850_cov28-Attheya_sp.AAC.1
MGAVYSPNILPAQDKSVDTYYHDLPYFLCSVWNPLSSSSTTNQSPYGTSAASGSAATSVATL